MKEGDKWGTPPLAISSAGAVFSLCRFLSSVPPEFPQGFSAAVKTTSCPPSCHATPSMRPDIDLLHLPLGKCVGVIGQTQIPMQTQIQIE